MTSSKSKKDKAQIEDMQLLDVADALDVSSHFEDLQKHLHGSLSDRPSKIYSSSPGQIKANQIKANQIKSNQSK